MRLAFSMRFARGLRERMAGLLNKRVCEAGEVLVLLPCQSIHTFGMREAIDIAFFDKCGVVVKAARALPPHRLRFCRVAVGVLERRSGGDTAWYKKGESVRLTIGSAEKEKD